MQAKIQKQVKTISESALNSWPTGITEKMQS
jgi:hypothetical protein